jgi:alcohol dehydrogenase (NADP+)
MKIVLLVLSMFLISRRSIRLTASAMSSQNISNSSCGTITKSHSIGLGTFLLERDRVQSTLRSAILDAGYRRIDCAPVYFNEDVIGDALEQVLQNNIIKREELYVVSKLASPFHRSVEAAVRKTLSDLRLNYLDLYLIHWPVAFHPVPIPDGRGWENEDIDDSQDGKRIDPTVSVHETWSAMEQLVEKGLVKEIGVSNFPVMLLHELLSQAKIPPVVNQCESHPYLQQAHLLQYCQARGVEFQAYSPLGSAGYKESHEPVVLQDPVILQLAKKHKATPAQIALAWALQRGTSVVVKSTNPDHLRDNQVVANGSIVLSQWDMELIQGMDRNYRFFRPVDWWGSMAIFH